MRVNAVRGARAHADPAAVRRILESLPDWFGEPSALEEYVADAARMPNYLAFARGSQSDGLHSGGASSSGADDPEGADGERVIGACLVNQHFPETAELHLIAVDPAWHRRGVGRAMVAAIEADLIARGTRLLEVKTIGPSSADRHYAETRKFYRGIGFLPLEELTDAWPPWPFLILVKPLSA